MNNTEIEYSRIKNVLVKDKNNRNNNLSTVLKSEMYEMLSNYMDVEGVECFVSLNDLGIWQIKVIASAKNFYSIKGSFFGT